MLVLITIGFLLGGSVIILLLRLLRPSFGYSWLIASGSVLAAWISVFAWQIRLPITIELTRWEPADLFAYSPALMADGRVWPLALALLTLCLATVLTAPMRTARLNSLAQIGELMLTAIGLIAVLARNPLTMLIAWSALDLAELGISLRTFQYEKQSEQAVFSFAVRSLGTGLVMWTSVDSMALGTPLDFSSMPPQIGGLLLVAAGLRLGVLPLHLPHVEEPNLRRGFGTILRLISVAASLVLLVRIPQSAISLDIAPWLFILTGVAALYGSWNWFRAADEMTGRPFWIIGMSALAVAAALGGNQTGSVAWGTGLILFGGIVFLYSHRSRALNIAVLVIVLGLLGLPFTLTATGWAFISLTYWWMWPPLLISHILLAAGFVRFILMPNKLELSEQQQWQRLVYPFSIGAMAVSIVLLGVWGWNGTLEVGTWWAAIVVGILTLAVSLLRLRVKILSEGQSEPTIIAPRPIIKMEQITGAIWSLYHTLRRLADLVAATFEGDGGILWTLLLLVLFITLIQGTR
jgi:hypothetical protein